MGVAGAGFWDCVECCLVASYEILKVKELHFANTLSPMWPCGQFFSCIICLVWSFKSATFCHYSQRKWLKSFHSQFLFKRFPIGILRANTEELCSKVVFK